MQLRQIQESDFERIIEIYSLAFEDPTSIPIEYAANLCYTNPEGCFAATVSGEVVGYVCSHTSGQIGYIGSLAVHPAHRGNGYGKAMTIAVRDHLAGQCEVIGLAVEPHLDRNLSLYASCGFLPVLPSCHVSKSLASDGSRGLPENVHSARQLGSKAYDVIRQIGDWTDELLPGLDFTRDLEHFVHTYPDDLLICFAEEKPLGFLAYQDWFRTDPWGAVRPGPNDIGVLDSLIAGMEESSS
jgi:GNAT superfamily N-acetyltransferase